MSDTLYNEQILALASDLVKSDRLEHPDATASVTSPLCGSRIKVDLTLQQIDDEMIVTAYGQDVRACALGQSSAALMRKLAPGKTLGEIAEAGGKIRAMLKEDAPPPDGEWRDYSILQPAKDHRSRHPAILLPFEAIAKAAKAGLAEPEESA